MEERTADGTPRAERYVVSKMDVSGLWGKRELTTDFDRHVNFLIGPNGAGKTTIVNLLSAVLSCDLRSLDRINFSSVRVALVSAGDSNATAAIEVSKTQDKSRPLPGIQFKITGQDGSQLAEYTLDDIEERLAIRENSRYFARHRFLMGNAVQQQLSKLVDLSWLPVHRHDSHLAERNDLGSESPVDLKLDDQANQLVRYFSKLDQRASAVFNDFQKSVFLSLLSGQEESGNFFAAFDFDVEKEKDALIPILEKFKIQRSRYQSKVDKHFETLASANAKSNDEGYSSNEVVAIVNQRRIHEVVQEWIATTQRQADIYNVRSIFVRVLNEMFLNKDVNISATNEVVVSIGRERPMSIKALSSGEKQLLIIMGQVLLQDCKATIFIADEPELSLHVSWQERLVESIRELNPSVQLIFATHSPDIVGKYGDGVIETSRIFVK